MKQENKSILVLLIFLFLYTPVAFAGNAALMLETFAKSFPALWKLAYASCYVIGILFMLRSVNGFRVLGEQRHGGSAKGPILLFIVGSALVFIPSVTQTMMVSVFGTTSPLQYPTTGGFDLSKYWAVLAFIQLIGMLSFIRGWIMIVGTAQQGSHHSMGKAITHIVGGILALNIGGLIDVINRSFGIG